MLLGRRRRAHARMLKLIAAFWQSQLIFVAAKLAIPDALASGPLTARELAGRVGVSSKHLPRIMRALSSLGVFSADAQNRFHLTPLGETLRSDHPDSLRNFALMLIDDYNWQAWGALHHAVTTGGSAFEHVHGVPVFAYMRQHPEKESTFSASMASISARENSAVARAYAFGRLHKLVDVGGAHGHLIATILRSYRTLHGVLFDQPQVIAAAVQTGFVTAPDIRARCEVSAGDFFASVPEGGDAYVMKYVIHDWDDENCVRILDNCRRAMAARGRVLVVEHLIAGGNRRDWGKMLDINMMVMPGGRERTREEFRVLFAQAGLRLQRVFATASSLSILEAVPA
jgi:O-methyltransferase domain/Dimerisation domain